VAENKYDMRLVREFLPPDVSDRAVLIENAVIELFNQAAEPPRRPGEPFAFQIERFAIALREQFVELIGDLWPRRVSHPTTVLEFMLDRRSRIVHWGIEAWTEELIYWLIVNPNPNDKW
jgi:hypothetical protein